MWVRFVADYEYRQPNFSIDYKVGMECNVTRKCAALAIAAGKAEQISKSREEPTEWLPEKVQARLTAV
ncbi:MULTISPECIES: hypothetical protein [unclassified Mesorhizobium]|uniref:hypothetical protein n=1 Tax=unclassified Mesorhizobium TaxID=325217 RepID=UPI000FDBDE00|nr:MULTISPECIES: hypothetical protein [unclassified Mesorhizobium]TGR58262.1 hypothetical protein EN842_01330 [bacterium M00.F.Ca.ET.199.01.1.1]TGU41630.1 hypothetical protein EN799_03485 [bacterium M00.F.Ca.ET.156.01.1.1]TGV89746.1 hypothetical protein EN792_006200 [Mesorhizobium sp. M00.F.Ca.ET.149.01.1.1]TGR33004.1 hypothetical protein EN840_01330 [Mesorhizobium sp. M8A.F.Ca.ET.197.01.1.1]TGR34650.1 hypothetical protein EN845_01330 [Mesorhizobium sp. M8A.F.Ca.ET.202.01.1.1]